MIWPILEARSEVQKYFCWFFGSNEDNQKSFWNYLTFSRIGIELQNRLELKRTGLKKIKWSQGFWLHIFFNYLQWNHICMNPFEGLHCLRNFKFVSTNYKYILIKIHVFNRQSSHRKISMILVNKVLWKLKLPKNVNNKKHASKLKKNWERFGQFLT